MKRKTKASTTASHFTSMYDHFFVMCKSFLVILSFCVGIFPATVSAGNLYVSQIGPIIQFDAATGALIRTFGSGSPPTGVDLGPDGNLYIGGGNFSDIRRHDPDTGAFIDIFADTGPTFEDRPERVRFGPDGNLYTAITNCSANVCGVVRFDGQTGAFIDEFLRFGGDIGHSFDFGPEGDLYVLFSGVSRFDTGTGNLLRTYALGPIHRSVSITFGPDGNMYVLIQFIRDFLLRTGVKRINPDTGQVDDFIPELPGGFPRDIAFGPDGNLYFIDGGANWVKRYDGQTGAFIDDFIPAGGVNRPEHLRFIAFLGPVNEPPTAEAGPSQSIHAGQIVQLDGSGSFDDNTPSEDLTYAWSITKPDGTLLTLTGPTPSFIADLEGDYQVLLVVTDAEGLLSAPDQVIISSLNAPPIAEAGPENVGAYVGELVTLDGSASIDPDGDPIQFFWDLGNGQTAASGVVQVAYDAPGTFQATLLVTDPFGATAQDTVTITVITGEDFAEMQAMETINTVGTLPETSVTTEGNQTALGNFLKQVVAALQEGDTVEAKKKLQDAIVRTDGCALRGTPDLSGGGQIKKDYVNNCDDQALIYPVLVEALNALNGS